MINEEVFSTLLQLIREADVETYREKMFSGEHINTSEDRAVLHVALRNFGDFKIGEPGVEVGVSDGRAYARATVDVPPALWPAAARAARDGTMADRVKGSPTAMIPRRADHAVVATP